MAWKSDRPPMKYKFDLKMCKKCKRLTIQVVWEDGTRYCPICGKRFHFESVEVAY